MLTIESNDGNGVKNVDSKTYGEKTLENSIIACNRCNSEAQIYNDIRDFLPELLADSNP